MVRVASHSFDEILTADAASAMCPYQTDAEEALLAGLPPAWEVTRAVGPDGDASIVVFLVDDTGMMPTFVLCERDGVSEIATIRSDIWESNQMCADSAKAVATIIANVRATSYRT